MHIGKHIWQILREKQISVKEFAEATNTERTTMYRILHRKSIDISVLVHYSRVLNHNSLSGFGRRIQKKSKRH